MKKDPLLIVLLTVTAIAGLGILMLIGKYVVTDKLDKDILMPLTTLLATLITVIGTRSKKDPPDDEPPTPPEAPNA